MEKPHNVRYSLIAFLIFSIPVPILLSDVNLLGNKGELYMEYWIFSVLALIPANIASNKGRSFAIWYIYGLCLFLIAFIHSLCIKDNDIAKTFKGWHKCRHCGEFSQPEATVCHCCGRDFSLASFFKNTQTHQKALPYHDGIYGHDRKEPFRVLLTSGPLPRILRL